MARMLQPLFCPSSSLIAAHGVGTEGYRDSAQFLASEQKTDQRVQPFGAVWEIEAPGTARYDDALSFCPRSEMVYQTLCRGFLRSSISRGTTKSKVEAPCASA